MILLFLKNLVICVLCPETRSVMATLKSLEITDRKRHQLRLRQRQNLGVKQSKYWQERRNHIVMKLTSTLYISRLGASRSCIASIPRKFKSFRNYVERSKKRLFLTNEPDNAICGKVCIEKVSKSMFLRIQEKQSSLSSRGPEPTDPSESAFGQLGLLGYGGVAGDPENHLFPIHRLDCATSGVMVFARNEDAASFLSKAWRDRESVAKMYLARVYNWPPLYHTGEISSDDWNTIDLPLQSAGDDSIKWRVCRAGDKGAKHALTLWKPDAGSSISSQNSFVTLLLKPVTGRTHQLRIHCAAVSDGIVGDRLYGSHQGLPPHQTSSHLFLHAFKLSFPHPTTRKVVEFTSQPRW